MKAKALVLSAAKKVELTEVEVAAPRENEVSVAVRVCGICAGDVYAFSQRLEKPRYPHRFGHEGVGVVRELGSGVEGLKAGDAVALMGGAPHFSEYVTVPRENVFALPAGADPLHLWLVEPVACVVNTLQHAGVTPGDTVAVIGTGFMGLLLLQGLRFTLAGEVYAADIEPLRVKLAEKFGPSKSFDLSSPSGKESLVAVGTSAYDGMNIVFEVSGVAGALDLAAGLVRRGGTLVIVGWHHEPRTLDLSRWHMGGYRVLNTSPMCEPNFGSVFGRSIRLMQRGVFDLSLLVTHVQPASHAQELFEVAASRADGYLKGVIAFGGNH